MLSYILVKRRSDLLPCDSHCCTAVRKRKRILFGVARYESNYRQDADQVVYSSEGILTRREVSLVNRLIRAKKTLSGTTVCWKRTAPGFTLERLM